MDVSGEKMFFQWKQCYETGVEEIDQQHKRLFELGNELFGSDYVSGRKIIIEFYKYTRYHFQAEEKYMQSIGYSDYEKHSIRHEKLISELNDISDNYFQDSRAFESFKVFVYHWINRHILDEDMRIVDEVGKF